MEQRFVGGVLSLLVCVSSVSFARFVQPMVRSDRREWRIEKQNAFAFPGRKNTEAKRREVWGRQIQRRKDICTCARDKRINKRNEKKDSYAQRKKNRKELKRVQCESRRKKLCKKCEAVYARVTQDEVEEKSEKVVKSEPKKHKKVKQKVAKNKPKKEKPKKIKPAVVASEDDHDSDDEFLLDEEDWPLAVI